MLSGMSCIDFLKSRLTRELEIIKRTRSDRERKRGKQKDRDRVRNVENTRVEQRERKVAIKK